MTMGKEVNIVQRCTEYTIFSCVFLYFLTEHEKKKTKINEMNVFGSSLEIIRFKNCAEISKSNKIAIQLVIYDVIKSICAI